MIRSLRAILRRRGGDPPATNLELGRMGERIARDYLERREGYSIVASNVQIPLGRARDGRRLSGEIDIIAYDRGTLVFVEVKTRARVTLVPPERNVDLRKQRQIARVARRYRQLMKVADEPHRYDVVTVILDGESEQVELLRGYFDDRVFHNARFFRRDFF